MTVASVHAARASSGTMWQRVCERWSRACDRRAVHRRENIDPSPFSWGFEWLQEWETPDHDTFPSPCDRLCDLSSRLVRNSDAFFAYTSPAAFELAGRLLRFRSPVHSPWPENDTVWAHWSPP